MALEIKQAEWLKAAVEPAHWPDTGFPEFAFSGRSNVGKSSLINVLTGRNKLARVSKTPGCTQKINFFEINRSFYFVDLPGYGYAKVAKSEKAEWGKMIETYLRESPRLAGLIQILDIRREPNDDDLQMLEWCAQNGIPTLIVLTKCDKLGTNQQNKQQAANRRAILERLPGHEPLFIKFSALKKIGKAEALEQLELGLESWEASLESKPNAESVEESN